MLRIVHIEEIEGLLLLLPDLVEQQKRRSPDFPRNADRWLSSLEQTFTSNRMYQVGVIAGLRSGLQAAVQGQVPAGIDFRGRPTRSKVASAVASQALGRAAETASSVIEQHRPRLAEADAAGGAVRLPLHASGSAMPADL